MTTPPAPAAGRIVAAEVAAFREEVRGLRVTPDVTPEQIRAHLAERYRFDDALPLDAALDDVIGMMRRWTLHSTHPRYFGLFNPSVHEAGIWGDTLAALYNPQMAAWAHAPAASEIERHVLHRLAAMIGEPFRNDGAHFTSGGSEANHTALLLALASRFPRVVQHGHAAIPGRPVFYVSAGGHHSLHKIARMIGLGDTAVREVRTDAAFRMDVGDLRDQLTRDLAAGRVPIAVVGTAGTTAAGAVDPLPAIAAACAERGVWFHVDAAWGGAALLSPALRDALRGIEHADSVTWDAHKWLSVPMGAGMFFTRRPELLRPMFSTDAGYVPAEGGGGDPYLGTMQWSRRFIGLKTFLTLAVRGTDGLRRDIERQAALGDGLRALLRGAGWIVVNDTPLPVVCFTHPAIRRGDAPMAAVLERVLRGGLVWLSSVAPGGGETVLRACITSYDTSAADLEVLLAELTGALDA